MNSQIRDAHQVRMWGWTAFALSLTIAVIWLFVQHPWVHNTHPPVHSVSRFR